MYLSIGDREYSFQKVELEIIKSNISNTFANFDKKTMRELIEHRRYSSVKVVVENEYQELLDESVGKALLQLKNEKDSFYKEFLNNYGDLNYTQFVVKGNDSVLSKKGIYTIVIDDQLVFAGVCANTFKLRFNQHIGNISPKCCYKDGTATHCHINARITEQLATAKIAFHVCPMKDVDEMKYVKNAIIKRFEPEWNLRTSREESFNLN